MSAAATPRRIAVVAHGGRLPFARARLEAVCRHHFRERFAGASVTAAGGDATRLAAEAVRAGADAVVAMGGDGTAHEVLQALRGGECALGVAPSGSGNDFAFHLGLPTAPSAALDAAANARVRSADRLEVNGRVVATAAVWGSGAGVVEDVERLRARVKNWGNVPSVARAAVYQAAAVSHLLRDPDEPFRLRVTDDDGEATYRAWSAAVGDSRRIGGAFLAFPDARKDDGEAELLVIEAGPWGQRVWTSALLRFGLHRARPGVRRRRLRRAALEFDRPLPWVADGEIQPAESRFEIHVFPAGLQLLRPTAPGEMR